MIEVKLKLVWESNRIWGRDGLKNRIDHNNDSNNNNKISENIATTLLPLCVIRLFTVCVMQSSYQPYKMNSVTFLIRQPIKGFF